MPRTSPILVTLKISWWKETLSRYFGFSENPSTLTIFERSPTRHHYLFNPYIWKPMTQSFQNTLTFDHCPFNSKSNTHTNLVYRILPHPKKAIFPTFSEQKLHFLKEKHPTELTTCPLKSCVCRSYFITKGGGLAKKKVVLHFSQCGGSQMYTASCKASYTVLLHLQFSKLGYQIKF